MAGHPSSNLPESIFHNSSYICIYNVDTYGLPVIIIGNGHGNLSSNPGQGCLHFM